MNLILGIEEKGLTRSLEMEPGRLLQKWKVRARWMDCSRNREGQSIRVQPLHSRGA